MTDLVFGPQRCSIEDVIEVARHGRRVRLSDDAAHRAHIEASAAFLEELLASDTEIYGVNTGYGDNCTVLIPADLVRELPAHLSRYHGCGLGVFLDEAQTLAVLVARLQSLNQGYSAVRWELLKALSDLIEHRILPRIPAEGSVGASGDLTPLSYIAATLIGERDVTYQGQVMPAHEALQRAGLKPLRLAPKEALALMNGTAVMTGLACLAFQRAEHLSRLAARLTALAGVALRSNRDHFHPRLFELKPHQGQAQAAAWIYGDLSGVEPESAMRLQDRYSVRCAPHVIGVLRDALPWIRRDVENELNSANDNPLFDGEQRLLLHGGHFYGGHIAFAMDALKTAVANLADLMDRQLALLVDPRYNHGLPQNLSGATGPRAAINHGLKAVQISSSAWTAEALKLTLPASIFSRSTECHNQDKVSMGTIAARDCLRVLELTEQVAAAHALAVMQGVRLREREGGALDRLGAEARGFFDQRARTLPFIEEDLPLDHVLRGLAAEIADSSWSLYP
ncbi:MAG: aromatic amino acid ammonia-lyase [Firmicutes bacterium]|nr:aromatic amino acid ammonia-lyase [Bacillota bacterium]